MWRGYKHHILQTSSCAADSLSLQSLPPSHSTEWAPTPQTFSEALKRNPPTALRQTAWLCADSLHYTQHLQTDSSRSLTLRFTDCTEIARWYHIVSLWGFTTFKNVLHKAIMEPALLSFASSLWLYLFHFLSDIFTGVLLVTLWLTERADEKKGQEFLSGWFLTLCYLPQLSQCAPFPPSVQWSATEMRRGFLPAFTRIIYMTLTSRVFPLMQTLSMVNTDDICVLLWHESEYLSEYK